MKKRKKVANKTKVASSKKSSQKTLPLHPFQTFLVGLLAGGLTWLAPLAKKEMLSSGVDGTVVNAGLPAGLPISEKEGRLFAYDPRTRVASWVYEHISPRRNAPLERAALSRVVFSYGQDPLLLAAQQASLDPSKSYSALEATSEEPWCNWEYWQKLEDRVGQWAAKYENIHAVTGTLFLPRKYANGKKFVHYSVVGEHEIAVPTHFYKVVLIESDGDIALKAYVIPNELIPGETPLADFEVSVKEVERMAGVTFFDNLGCSLATLLKE